MREAQGIWAPTDPTVHGPVLSDPFSINETPTQSADLGGAISSQHGKLAPRHALASRLAHDLWAGEDHPAASGVLSIRFTACSRRDDPRVGAPYLPERVGSRCRGRRAWDANGEADFLTCCKGQRLQRNVSSLTGYAPHIPRCSSEREASGNPPSRQVETLGFYSFQPRSTRTRTCFSLQRQRRSYR